MAPPLMLPPCNRQLPITGARANAVESLFLSAGGGSLFESSDLQRFWRDVHGVGQHAALNYDSAVSGFGRHVFGLPPEGPGF